MASIYSRLLNRTLGNMRAAGSWILKKRFEVESTGWLSQSGHSRSATILKKIELRESKQFS